MRAADAAEKITREKPRLLRNHKRELLGLLAEAQQAELRWHLAAMIPRLDLTATERRNATAAFKSFLEDAARSSKHLRCKRWQISRAAQDQLAYESHMHAAAAERGFQRRNQVRRCADAVAIHAPQSAERKRAARLASAFAHAQCRAGDVRAARRAYR